MQWWSVMGCITSCNVCNSFRLLAGFVSPVGDNGQTGSALSPIRCFTSHVIHTYSNINFPSCHWWSDKGCINFRGFNSFLTPFVWSSWSRRGCNWPNAYLNECCWRLGGGATLPWLLAVFSHTFAEELLLSVYRSVVVTNFVTLGGQIYAKQCWLSHC